MLIDLQEPFKSMWEKGYLVTDDEGRQRVVFYNSPNTRSGMTYARYLMCVKLGYILPTEVEVDHIDEDKTNDILSNLQLLSRPDNIAKSAAYRSDETEVYGYECAVCLVRFVLTKAVRASRLARGTEMAYCSKGCSDIGQARVNQISDEMIERIKELKSNGGSSYSISKDLGISRNTVMKYW